jgi:hypothetical protein
VDELAWFLALPKDGKRAALILPACNTEAMSAWRKMEFRAGLRCIIQHLSNRRPSAYHRDFRVVALAAESLPF